MCSTAVRARQTLDPIAKSTNCMSTGDCFADCPGISSIVFQPLDVGPHVGQRHQPRRMVWPLGMTSSCKDLYNPGAQLSYSEPHSPAPCNAAVRLMSAIEGIPDS